jgi:hypothetical protein
MEGQWDSQTCKKGLHLPDMFAAMCLKGLGHQTDFKCCHKNFQKYLFLPGNYQLGCLDNVPGFLFVRRFWNISSGTGAHCLEDFSGGTLTAGKTNL